jgi:hypothetical protein
MNLKYFHFVFLIASALVAFLFAGWEISNYLPSPQTGTLIGAIIAAIIGIGLIVYAILFLKKTRKLIL